MIFAERRRPAFTGELLVRVGLIWLVVSAIFVATKWAAIRALALPDADDTLRMVQVRDLLAGQPFWDLHQYRIDPPQGILMHWSRLVDLPLYLIELALRPIIGPAMAERAALVIVPLLTLGTTLLMAARLAWRTLDAELIGYVCLVIALASPVTGQMQPLRIDHHGWQIVAALVALNGLTARSERTGGFIAGAALALGMTISLELLPIAVLFGCVLALRWLRDQRARTFFISFLQALALTGVAAFFAVRGLADLANHCDTLSPAYLGALVVTAGAATLLSSLPRQPRIAMAVGLGLVAVLAAGTFLAMAPTCRTGPFATLDPLVREFWYDNVHEGKPVWLQKPPVLAQMILPPLIGLYAALKLWSRSRDWLRRFWFEYALLLAGSLLLAVFVARASAFACAFAAVPLGWQLREWHRRAQALRRPLPRVAAIAAMSFAVMPALPLLAANALAPAKAASAAPLRAAQQVCDIPAAAPALNRLAPATLFAPIDIGPVLLANTHHSVVATAHHRAPQALHDVIAAFIADPAAARGYVARHGARYVVICAGLIEADNYRLAAPRGFMASLEDGQVPVWLRPVPLAGQSGLQVWEVLPPDQAGTKASATPFMQ
ncbi:hypothetical protein [Novosphingobium sp.]|uniref:hypothetical protein n=1 Tax=Novosphingobium sp. TaxID=1874826 RepID=UPI0035B4372D